MLSLNVKISGQHGIIENGNDWKPGDRALNLRSASEELGHLNLPEFSSLIHKAMMGGGNWMTFQL